jgi:hypothetical protein
LYRQPLPVRPLDQFNDPLPVRQLAGLDGKAHLRRIAGQVFAADRDVQPVNRPAHAGKERLHRVAVDARVVGLDVLALVVWHHAVPDKGFPTWYYHAPPSVINSADSSTISRRSAPTLSAFTHGTIRVQI